MKKWGDAGFPRLDVNVSFKYNPGIMSFEHCSEAEPAGLGRIVLYCLFWLAFVLSGISPVNRIVWLGHSVVPLLIALILYKVKDRFLPSMSTSIALFGLGLLLLAGGHFQFHAAPFLRITLPDGMERSSLDWLTHGVDGMVFVLLARDVLSVRGRIRENRLFRIIAVLCAMGLASGWELTEIVVGLISDDLFFMTGGLLWDTYIDLGVTLAAALLLVPWLKLHRRTMRPTPSLAASKTQQIQAIQNDGIACSG